MKTKIISAVMVITLLISALGIIGVSAATYETYGDLTYTVSNKEITITDCKESATGNLVIPAKINNYPVTAIGYRAFYNCTGLTSVTIPDSVTSIGYQAFYECTGLTSVTIPNSVTSIGEWAFYNCRGLTSITIPDSVTTIGNSAFCYCSGLERVNITDLKAWCEIEFAGEDSNPLCYAGKLYLNGSRITKLEIPNNITCIGKNVFVGYTDLIEVTIPKSVTSIGKDAFYRCEGITKVNITDLKAWCEIEFEDDRANPLSYAKKLYLNGSQITKLEIPTDITKIENYAFSECNSFTDVTIPDSVTAIGDKAFYNCRGLTSITIPNSVKTIGEYAFGYCIGLTGINLGNGLTTIGESAFYDCTGLKELTIPNSVTNIENYAFYGCSGLTSVTIGNGVKTIGDRAFHYCRELKSLTIPDSVTSIANYAFTECTGLTNVTIGNGVEEIPEGAFYYCNSLKYVTIGSEVKYIRNEAFSNCSKIETVFYAGSEAQWNDILFYNINENLTNANIIYNAKKKTYKFVTNCDATLNDITDYAIFDMPVVEDEGRTLTGWYTDAKLSGSPVTFPYYGSATTLYAGWTDRTGKSFDDAIIAKVNREYSVTTTESGQMIYYEFVPTFSKTYKIYSTGSNDIYGFLYNSRYTQLASNDDGGDGSNFYISYSLTAGQKYYIGAKMYNGYGTFGIYIEEPVDYRINEITIKDGAGNNLTSIPKGNFLATVSFTNVSANEDTVIVLARYTSDGVFDGLMYASTEGMQSGTTLKLTIPVDNTKGEVAKLKAFCLETFGSITPMGNAVSFPAEN